MHQNGISYYYYKIRKPTIVSQKKSSYFRSWTARIFFLSFVFLPERMTILDLKVGLLLLCSLATIILAGTVNLWGVDFDIDSTTKIVKNLEGVRPIPSEIGQLINLTFFVSYSIEHKRRTIKNR
ncbi:hypothetical protein BDR26DRAFT_868523 [Obelidium mucronatum]|nr:hypothetical protein BDR26DRAFT_868523 [Obelidium mucronatum]